MSRQRSIGREAAIALAKTEWWTGKSDRDVVAIQLFTAERWSSNERFIRRVSPSICGAA